MVFYLISILFVFIADNHVDSLSCKIKSGKLLFRPNWLIIYKPSISSLENGHFFYHGSDDKIGWHLGKENIFKKDSTLTGIFKEIYQDQTKKKSSRKISYIHYDNQILWMRKQKYSDLKGSLIWNTAENLAIWIIHTSYFDISSGKYRFSKTSVKAHLFSCITITASDISMILGYLEEAKVKIYDKFIVNEDKKARQIRKDNIMRLTKLGMRKKIFQSGGTFFSIIVKGKNDHDFWQKVDNELGVENLYFVKSYLPLSKLNHYKPDCKDVLELTINKNKKKSITWKSDMDKSKFFMGYKDRTYFFCISDTNRYFSATKHGFALCIFDYNLYKTFENSINKPQECD